MARIVLGKCSICGQEILKGVSDSRLSGVCSRDCPASLTERRAEKAILFAKALTVQTTRTEGENWDWTHVVFPLGTLVCHLRYAEFDRIYDVEDMTVNGELRGELIRQLYPELKVSRMYADVNGRLYHRPIQYPAAFTDGYGYVVFESEAEMVNDLGTGELKFYPNEKGGNE